MRWDHFFFLLRGTNSTTPLATAQIAPLQLHVPLSGLAGNRARQQQSTTTYTNNCKAATRVPPPPVLFLGLCTFVQAAARSFGDGTDGCRADPLTMLLCYTSRFKQPPDVRGAPTACVVPSPWTLAPGSATTQCTHCSIRTVAFYDGLNTRSSTVWINLAACRRNTSASRPS